MELSVSLGGLVARGIRGTSIEVSLGGPVAGGIVGNFGKVSLGGSVAGGIGGTSSKCNSFGGGCVLEHLPLTLVCMR